MDEFEDEFGDELDALKDMEDDFESVGGGSKKSLNFTTPSNKSKSLRANLDDSFPTPLASPHFEEKEKTSSEASGNGGKKSKKRPHEDLFGDLSDDEEFLQQIEEEMPDMVHRKKKAKVQEKKNLSDDDFEITPPPSPDISDKVRNLRKKTIPDVVTSKQQDYEDRITDSYDFERQRVFKRMPPGAFMHATGKGGKRVYMKMKPETAVEKEVAGMSSGQRSLQLLGTPLAVLKAQVEEESRNRVLQESQRITENLNRDERKRATEDGHSSGQESHGLWVEKYTPRCYTDLLSDEATNRTLLKWLKLWDYVVFGKEVKAPKEKKENKKDQKKEAFKKKQAEVTDELDAHKRPQQKVALLCGPPGLGKTTLAHIIARHAGYSVVEMNASDDRSAEVFKTKIESATQMKSVIGVDARPNCLIIDEIDGAPQPAINALLAAMKDPQQSTGKKKKKDGELLRRPIICICNDLYVPALRQLRQQALVINFPPTVSAKLAGRLFEITRTESLKTDLTTLLALCEKAENDIRSCLNTLQFIRSRARELNLRSVHSMSLGQKDAHKSFFKVWQHIFTMPKPQRKRYVNPYDRGTTQGQIEELENAMNQNNTSLGARFISTLQLAQAAGEADKVLQGLYDNYLESKVKDPRLDAIQLASEWTMFMDEISGRVGRTQNYTLMAYSPYLPVAFHLLFASNAHPKINYPNSQYEAHIKLSKTNNLVTTMMNDTTPGVRKNLTVSMVATELLPPLMDIIQPNLRPVNTQLYSAREKSNLATLVKIMIAYNMTYRQERSPEGQYVYTLDPNVSEIVVFENQKNQRQLTYAAKQLISREIELEKMRRTEGVAAPIDVPKTKPIVKEAKKPVASAASSASASSSSESQKKTGDSKQDKDAAQLPNYMRQKLEPKAITVQADVPCKDFFGRTVSVQQVQENKKKQDSKNEIIGGDIWFHFKEGFTNAVRKTVRIHDLL